jgi:filamentous hemagglutinin
MQILLKDQENNGVLSNTSIHYFGPADHAQDAANQLDTLSNGQQNYVELQNHKDDFVGGLIGNNQATYGKTPDGSNKLKETLNIFTGDHTAHSCYGANPPPECKGYGTPQTLRIYSNGSKP